MPIKGISDILRFPRAGKIHLGIKAVNSSGKEYPKSTDFFVLPEDRPDLAERFGKQPRELLIMFPTDDIDVVAPQWFKRYGSGTGLACRGDGETASMVDTETGEMVDINCPGQECEWYEKKHCRHVLNLQFLLPDFISDGMWQLDTGSFFSITNFNGSWHFIKQLTRGRIAMIPLLLRVVPREVAPGGKKKIVHVLELRLAEKYSLNDIQAIAAGAEPAPIAALPEPDLTTEPEHFYPPEVRPAAGIVHDTLPDTEDEIVDELAASMEPDELDIDIIAVMDELDLTTGQRTTARRKYPDREELLRRMVAQRDGKDSNVRELRPEAPTPPTPPEAPERSTIPAPPIATAPAAPSRPTQSYF